MEKTETQQSKVIRSKEVEVGIIAIVANAMVEHAKRLATRIVLLHAAALSGRVLYVSLLMSYMFYRGHTWGAFLVLFICVLYDHTQVELLKKNYTELAVYAAATLLDAGCYICNDGKAFHLCMVVFGMFAFRYLDLMTVTLVEDAEDILRAKNLLVKEGLGGNKKIVVTTRREKQYTYEWDEQEIIDFLEGGGKIPEVPSDEKIANPVNRIE